MSGTTLTMLAASLLDMPIASDSLVELQDVVRSGPAATPEYYPQAVPTTTRRLWSNVWTSTLFWIFYYQQGTPLQVLAAEELRKSFWRYHRKFQLWLQRHPRELPSEITSTMERGTFVFWDEKTWQQRTRADFVLQYAEVEP
jgi:CCR4-NOT transcription complex subunit 3